MDGAAARVQVVGLKRLLGQWRVATGATTKRLMGRLAHEAERAERLHAALDERTAQLGDASAALEGRERWDAGGG